MTSTATATFELPKAKQTVLGLYVTAREAYEMWTSDPDNVKILDVRTPEEYFFVGHPAMARNIPIAFAERRVGSGHERAGDEAGSGVRRQGQKILRA